jgi:hypothetical protein
VQRVGLITAGLGSKTHIEAGRRVARVAEKFNCISFIKAFEETDLKEFAPRVFKTYANVLSSETKGFGYFAWKPELVLSTLRKFELDLVIWVDAGCELNINALSHFKFNTQVKNALKRGYYFYDLDYPEESYTKRDVQKKFPNVQMQSRQVQATYFMIGKSHVDLIEKWTECVLDDLKNIDLSPSVQEESKSFIEHRFDQSLLSLIVKSEGLKISRLPPSGGVNSFRSLLRSVFEPVWTIRNRTGESQIKKQIKSVFFRSSRN